MFPLLEAKKTVQAMSSEEEVLLNDLSDLIIILHKDTRRDSTKFNYQFVLLQEIPSYSCKTKVIIITTQIIIQISVAAIIIDKAGPSG